MIRLILAATAALLLAAPGRAAVDIQEVTSPGGIDAWLVENHDLPFTALEIRFEGGASLEAEGKRGAINLMTGLLEEGAGELDAQAFAARREALAAKFGFDVHDDSLSVSAKMLTENRDEAAKLLKTALTEPRFDPRAVDRVRGQVLSIIRSDRTDPQAIAGRRFAEAAFDGHPYGSALEGTAESVRALTRADLIEAKDRVIARDNVVVGAAGDITPEALGKLLDTLLGGLPETSAAGPGPAELRLDGGVTVVAFDTPQSVALFGQEGIARDDPDFFAAYVLNTALGGNGFSSRLMEELREKRGLTYGVYTYLVPKEHADLVMGQVASANDKMAEAVAQVQKTWRDVARNGIPADRIEAAKTYLTGAYPLRFDGNGPIATILAGMQLDDLSPDYVETRNDRMRAVTAKEVRRVAKRLLKPDRLSFVVVGQPEGLGAQN